MHQIITLHEGAARMTSKDRPAETGLWQIARIGSRDRVVANAGRMAARHETAVADVARGVPRVAVRIVGEEHRPKGVVPGEIIVHRKDRAAAEKLLGDALVRVEEPACDLPVVKLVTEIHQDRSLETVRAGGQHHVLWLDVSVKNAVLVCNAERIDHLSHGGEPLLERPARVGPSP